MAKGLVNSQPEPTPFLQASPEGRHARSPNPSAVTDTATLGSTLVNQLFARQAVYNTCGYTGGDPALPITCTDGLAETSGCVYYDGSPANFACCALNESHVPITGRCLPVSKCLEPTDPRNSNTGGGPLFNNGTVNCPSSDHCVTTVLFGTGTGTVATSFLQYGCNVSVALFTAFQQATFRPTQSSQSTTTTTTEPSKSSSSTLELDSTTSSASATAQPSEAADSDTKTNTGAIVGGVVGGVAAVALIGGVFGYVAWMKKKQRKEPMREIAL